MGPTISRRYPLEQINEAITAMETGEALRSVIVFGERRADSQSAWTH